MNDYTRKDINSYDTFTKYGDTFTKIYADDENHIYVFKCGFGYEVVKGIKSVNPLTTPSFITILQQNSSVLMVITFLVVMISIVKKELNTELNA